MKHLIKWTIFNEAQSYPNSIYFYVNLIYDKCEEILNNYLISDEEDLNKKIKISFNEIKNYSDNSEFFIDFPVENIEVNFDIIGSYDFNFGGESKIILPNKNSIASYLQKSKSKKVDESIFYRCDVAIGVDRNEDIKFVKEILKDVITHEVQHGYDNYNRVIKKNINIYDDYLFYVAVKSMTIDYENSELILLLLESIYNCSEMEMKSIISEPGPKISLDDWKRVLNKRGLNYNYNNLLNELKNDENYYEYLELPSEILDEYLDLCDEYSTPLKYKYTKI